MSGPLTNQVHSTNQLIDQPTNQVHSTNQLIDQPTNQVHSTNQLTDQLIDQLIITLTNHIHVMIS